ncbi:D-lactate dehydrogenase [Chenggangzhangella methanolivorans]|uniref:D-lactate dehydrogenase n=1 Tax=Chenggangzhangella methanolivorans TaxID=1437009 RepID=UPI0021BD5F65|nr:D-lactate dehydrogenase [Chenggangzhangella methanolivorans]
MIVEAGRAAIFQAANTGLTGGSTPWGDDYDREIVLVSVMRLKGVHLIEEGRQVCCLPGATLDSLEKLLRPLGREPHSVIGSSCIGASVLGGVCNNSGGSLIQRGPAYTEMTLFAEVREDGSVALVNHLGFDLGEDPEELLSRVERGDLPAPQPSNAWASDREYASHVRDVDADTPARFNAHPRRLREASGCAGKLAVFAVRLDTFAAETETAVFYVGTNDPAELTEIRRHVLASFETLPIAAEYLHREAYDVAAKYGKDTFLFIQKAGTDRMPAFFSAKARRRADRAPEARRHGVGQAGAGRRGLTPQHLPARMNGFRDAYEHHLMLKMGGAGVAEAQAYLSVIFPSKTGRCSVARRRRARPRSSTVSRWRAPPTATARSMRARSRTSSRSTSRCVATTATGSSAFRPRSRPRSRRSSITATSSAVFHQDYVVKKGHDCIAVEHEMWKLLDQRGAEYPAEHNVGHLYHAKPALADFYKKLDPTNSLNPGIGQTSKCRHWGCADADVGGHGPRCVPAAAEV